ncbi:spirocyclase AveC family protein [Pseudonocardia eucalypti]|uniref:Spirocyclase AveC family protein n=1 Tax=Pseudonocardia eucalypti TaxID=648755 RepID=A0ABP9QNT5_9PSEU|nr:hypothetical protein [Pseudonocardia eucalypti]
MALPNQYAVSTPTRFRPVLAWATVGAAVLGFQVFVLARWVTSANFTPTDPGPDEISPATRAFFLVLQVAIPLGAAVAMWFWVIRPWRRTGELTTDGMLVLAGAMLFFWDMSLNYSATALLYNSHFVNFGAWANGAWPSWISPNGNRLPEPIFICQPGYTSLVFSQVMLILWIMRKIKARRPALPPAQAVAIMVVGLVVIDTIIESILLRIGIYAYPHGIRWLSLYAGETYQLPMTEPIFFAGCGLGTIAALSYFRNDRGQTVAELGANTLRMGRAGRRWVRFLAVFGAVHTAFAVLYFVPSQWLATHGDAFPAGYPSYLINDMCDYRGDQPDLPPCPAPGVPFPRP